MTPQSLYLSLLVFVLALGWSADALLHVGALLEAWNKKRRGRR